MITKEQALTVDVFYHVSRRNADGSAQRWSRHGQTKTWKRRPQLFRIPVKHGLYSYQNITTAKAEEFLVVDPTGKSFLCHEVGLDQDCPDFILVDKLIEQGYGDVAEAYAKDHGLEIVSAGGRPL